MHTDEMIELCKSHTLYNWAATGQVDPLPITRAEGIYLYGPDGKRYLDFNSQLMSVNIGHSHPRVIEAIKSQLDELIYVFPGSATPVRARLGKKLAEILPGDLNTVFFTLGGAESNENAIKAARQYSGRFKILSRYRSYHGATHGCMQLTGDPRRWQNEPGAPGFIKVMDPEPYTFSFGKTDAEKTERNLQYLEEVIQYEGPDNIAAMFIESVTGTNGILPPPKGYLQGLRKLLDRYGILMVCDEVMAGFGRTGKMFAFEHGDIIPDIVTMAKGLTSSYLPLGAMAMRDPIAQHFRENVFWGGLTYNSHPLALRAAEAAIDVLIDEDLVSRAAELEKVMHNEISRLTQKHPSLKGGRAIGLFGILDIQADSKGTPIAGYNSNHPAMAELRQFLLNEGLFTFLRWSHVYCNPPLCISEEELLEGFQIIDRGLAITDSAFSSD